jgi:hypothetical protein
MADVLLHGLERDHKLIGDVAVPFALGDQRENLELSMRQGFDQSGHRAGILGTLSGCLERSDKSIDVLLLCAALGGSGPTSSSAYSNEASKKGGHWPPFVGKDADISFWPCLRECVAQDRERTAVIAARLHRQGAQCSDLDDASHPVLRRGEGVETIEESEGPNGL